MFAIIIVMVQAMMGILPRHSHEFQHHSSPHSTAEKNAAMEAQSITLISYNRHHFKNSAQTNNTRLRQHHHLQEHDSHSRRHYNHNTDHFAEQWYNDRKENPEP